MPRIAAASSSSAHARPPLREAKRHLLTAVGRFAIFRPFREAPAVNEDDLRVLIRDQFLGGDSSVPIPADLDLVAAGICDSFALLELSMAIESRLSGVTIPDSDVTPANLGSIERIMGYLAENGG